MAHRFTTCRLVQAVSDGVVRLEVAAPGIDSAPVAVWTLCRTRKNHVCAVTGITIPAGSEAYRPVGNHDYRMDRIAQAVVDSAVTNGRPVADG